LGALHGQSILTTQDPRQFKSWWDEAETKIAREERRRFNGLVIFTLWNLWKERNRRIFNDAHESELQVAASDLKDQRGHRAKKKGFIREWV
jgi:hypothetical protein